MVQNSLSDIFEGTFSICFFLTAGNVLNTHAITSDVKLYFNPLQPSVWGFISAKKAPETPAKKMIMKIFVYEKDLKLLFERKKTIIDFISGRSYC